MRLSCKYLLFLNSLLIALICTGSASASDTSTAADAAVWQSTTAITFHPIGILHSAYKTEKGTPLHPNPAGGEKAKIIIFPEYVKALKDLEGFSHVWLISYFDRARPWKPVVIPYMDNKEHGVFATRCPSRPNPIGLSVVKLSGIKNNEVEVEGVDILDNTPILDIKPYLSDEAVAGVKTGWLKNASGAHKRTADDCFAR